MKHRVCSMGIFNCYSWEGKSNYNTCSVLLLAQRNTELQSDNLFKEKANCITSLDFCKRLLIREKYLLLLHHPLFTSSVFGSTYICEQPFSRVKSRTSKISWQAPWEWQPLSLNQWCMFHRNKVKHPKPSFVALFVLIRKKKNQKFCYIYTWIIFYTQHKTIPLHSI